MKYPISIEHQLRNLSVLTAVLAAAFWAHLSRGGYYHSTPGGLCMVCIGSLVLAGFLHWVAQEKNTPEIYYDSAGGVSIRKGSTDIPLSPDRAALHIRYILFFIPRIEIATEKHRFFFSHKHKNSESAAAILKENAAEKYTDFLHAQKSLDGLLALKGRRGVHVLLICLIFTTVPALLLWHVPFPLRTFWFLVSLLYTGAYLLTQCFISRNLPQWYLTHHRGLTFFLFLLFCNMYFFHYLVFIHTILNV
jgi:hypothetical protein